MLKAPSAPIQTTQQGRGTKGLQFFRPVDIPGSAKDGTAKPITVRIVSVSEIKPTDKLSFGDYKVKLSLVDSGENRLWPLRVNSVAFAALYGMFGADEKKWSGRTISVTKTYNETFEQDQVTVLEK